MRITLVFLIVILFSANISGQNSYDSPDTNPKGKFLFEAGVGFSVPSGLYELKDKDNPQSGYAVPGWIFRLGADWNGQRNLGFTAQYYFQSNGTQSPVNLLHPNGFEEDDPAVKWTSHYLLIGPLYNGKVGRWTFQARMTGGLVVSWSKLFDTPDPTDTTALTADNNLATGYAMGVWADAGYHLSKKITLKGSLGWLGGWPGISRQYSSVLLGYRPYRDPVTGIISYKPLYSAAPEYKIKKAISTFNISLGIQIRF
jgi:hypothetical protein